MSGRNGRSSSHRVFGRRPVGETLRIDDILRAESVGGFLLVGAAIAAVIGANGPLADEYSGLRDARVGYAPWHLELSVGQWAADGLLAVFFFLVGLELKREIVIGRLRSVRTAVVPVVAAVGGVVVPAMIYAAVNRGSAGSSGWAIPTATDIAFAVAVLAVVGSRLPVALRLFLLTLAVVDDLIAIAIIAIFYADHVNGVALLGAAVPLALFCFLAHRCAGWFARTWWAAWATLLPLGVVVWALVHASGIHATIAGVLLGFAVPVRSGGDNGGGQKGLAERFEHRFRPLSAGLAVPVFAFFAAGVTVGGEGSLTTALTDPVAVGVVLGLLLGKPVGILGATWLVVRFTDSELDDDVQWRDLAAVSLLAGIGFTVSLLVAELSFPADPDLLAHAKIAVLVASTTAALVAGGVLALQSKHHDAHRPGGRSAPSAE